MSISHSWLKSGNNSVIFQLCLGSYLSTSLCFWFHSSDISYFSYLGINDVLFSLSILHHLVKILYLPSFSWLFHLIGYLSTSTSFPGLPPFIFSDSPEGPGLPRSHPEHPTHTWLSLLLSYITLYLLLSEDVITIIWDLLLIYYSIFPIKLWALQGQEIRILQSWTPVPNIVHK